MSFNVIIPARLASSRLPNKPLLDMGGKPMIVRTAEQSLQAGAKQVIVATDHPSILTACQHHGIHAVMTQASHPSGTDRIAEAAQQLHLQENDVVVNVQGDEPLIAPDLIAQVAALIQGDNVMATAAHAITQPSEVFNPNVVKVVINHRNQALYFSRASIPWNRDEFASIEKVKQVDHCYRHIGIYAYQNAFLQKYAQLPVSPLESIEMLEQLRVLWNGYAIAVHLAAQAPATGVDTPEDYAKVKLIFEQSSI